MPSGRLAFFFTDIEGSTSRWERFPDAMKDALLRHDRIVRDAIEARGGCVFKTVGDAFCAVFESILAAAEAAIDVQRSLGRASFEAVDGLGVRIAMHVGTATERDADYFGTTVNRVARLLAVAHGGQIVLTQPAMDDLRDSLPEYIDVRDLGEHRLRDLKVPEHVAQIFADGMRSEFPPLRSLDAYTNNLPLQLTEIIGRREEIRDVRKTLGESRVVTITGTGGVGKTRVALQVAAEMNDAFPNGVWFVDLAPLQDATFVSSAFGVALGISQSAEGRPTEQALVEHLRAKKALLVVDNCEHVIEEAVRYVGTIARACPRVSILATSRERLGIAGERVYVLPSLSVPPVDNAGDLMQYDAYAFYVDRASAVRSGFSPSVRDGSFVSEICRRLDGIPFAIELAAARSRLLTPRQIIERLDQRLRFLVGGSRDVSPRQQSVRALIDWTHDSLGKHERTVFARLAIFAGGWTLEAAEAVCSDDELSYDAVVDVLASLVEKSLVHPELGNERMRYGMHETTRAYALECLVARGERDRLSRRHAEWIADLLASIETTANAAIPFSELVLPETDNVRVALSATLDPSGGDRALAARIAASAARMWYDAGLLIEGSAWIQSLLAEDDDTRSPALTAALWQGLARLLVAKRTIEAATRALVIYERIDHRRGIALALIRIAFGYWQTRSMHLAEVTIDRALRVMAADGRQQSADYADALDTRGNLYLNLGRREEARASLLESLRIYMAVGEDLGSARVRGNLAELSFADGDHAMALEYVHDAARTFHRLRSRTRECMALVNSASYRLASGDVSGAEKDAHASMTMARRVGDRQICAIAIQIIACVEAWRGHHDTAAILLGYADEWYRTEGYSREWSEAKTRAALATKLESAMPSADLERALAVGAALDQTSATDLALDSPRLR